MGKKEVKEVKIGDLPVRAVYRNQQGDMFIKLPHGEHVEVKRITEDKDWFDPWDDLSEFIVVAEPTLFPPDEKVVLIKQGEPPARIFLPNKNGTVKADN